MRPVSVIGMLVLAAGTATLAWPAAGGADAARMADAARSFLASLDDAGRARARFPFGADERANWQFVPGQYPGLPLEAMTLDQRRAAFALLQAALSAAGYLKTTAIVQLETLLRSAAEAAGQRADHRDPERYSFAVFGEPSTEAPWGWRVQGHHVSLNFSSVAGEVVATTPAFLGANPHEIRTGPYAGMRALGSEEDRARALLASLDDEQRAAAILEAKAPRDVILGPGVAADRLGAPRGVSHAAMEPAQRALLWALIEEYAGNLAGDFRRAQLERIEAAGRDRICFSWAGGTTRGEPHYYRVHGPTFVIEYDNTQDGANHVHTVWRDLTSDFGGDLLRAHYDTHPHHRDR